MQLKNKIIASKKQIKNKINTIKNDEKIRNQLKH